MSILITGASGYIGSKLANSLAWQGNQVHALVRSEKAKKWLHHANITTFIGDVEQKESIAIAAKGCKQVYHVAARVGAWAKNASVFYDVNVEGTRNVLNAAVQAGIEKLVFTSTSGVLGPAYDRPLQEDAQHVIGFTTDYDRTKKLAEDDVLSYSKKLNAVIVNPGKVYGPGHVSHPFAANAVINSFLSKKFTFIPGPDTYKVCFAYVDDVVNGHILAMQKGVPGERYILGGINISYYDFFDRIRILSQCNGRIIKVPKRIAKFVSYLQQLRYHVTGIPIGFSAKSVDYAFSNYIFSSEKAKEQLGYSITPLEEALRKTIQFFENQEE
ncbi:MAG TPA: NAD-dependent epimerase/dehydratase family protein [Chryseolinea sp.]|nr:NAD-dependent epimerase/dehydratase family protein [Chryseolinea sp.]